MNPVASVLRIGFKTLLSPTLILIGLLKGRCHEVTSEATLIRAWNWTFLGLSLGLCVVLYAVPATEQLRGARASIRLFLPINLFLWLLPFSRSNEIAYAFAKDAFRELRDPSPRLPLNAEQRIKLAARSYLELISNFALIHYTLSHVLPFCLYSRDFRDVAEAFYFSAITMTTVGYGDISPKHVVSQLLSIYEVLVGFGLVVLAVGVYISHAGRRS
jgi:voltage-gated potassium channel